MFCIVEILVITPVIDGSEHTVKSSRRGGGGDLKVPNFLPLIFKSWFESLVVARGDLRFMNVCQQPCIPDLQLCLL